MISGVGLDIVDVEQFRRSMERFGDRFLGRIFTDRERQFCSSKSDPALHYAARFAAREALVKAAGALPGFSLRDIEVAGDPSGRPHYVLHNAAADALGGRRLHLSLTHERPTAAAIAIIEKTPEDHE